VKRGGSYFPYSLKKIQISWLSKETAGKELSQSGRRNKRLGVRFSFAEKDEIKKARTTGKDIFSFPV